LARAGSARRISILRERRSAARAAPLVFDRQYDQAVQRYDLSTLATGERVISEQVPSVRSVSLGFWIGTGSRDETDARAGLSHFIEHLLFKGSGSHSAQEIAEIFDGLGGELNAATSRETTLVYARVPDDRLEPALDVIVGMVYDPAFADIDSEREVVLEEIAMVDDNPQDLVHDVVAEAVFGGHPLGRPVIGRADVISTVGRRALETYHRAAYAHDNIVVAVAGNVTHERVLELLSARLPKTEPPARRTRKPFSRAPAPAYRFQRKATEQYHVCLGAPGISRRDERRFAASLLDAILGGSASSRLFQEIREKRGMAYSVYSFASQYSDSGQVGLYVGTREENLVECLEIVARELGDVSAGNVRPGELERAKENLKGRMLLSMESTSNRMSRLGKSLITDTELLSLDEIMERIDAVTADDVAALAGDLLRLDRLSAAGIGPSEARFRAAIQRVNPALVGRKAA
jgi:predicted Zn-dependent peptidase